MLNDLDVVSLKSDLPNIGLEKGARGTIVHIHHVPNVAYEVEFCNDDGETIAMIPLLENQISLEWSMHKPRLAA